MAARVRVRKDRTDDTGYPWHFSVEWPVPAQDRMADWLARPLA